MNMIFKKIETDLVNEVSEKARPWDNMMVVTTNRGLWLHLMMTDMEDEIRGFIVNGC